MTESEIVEDLIGDIEDISGSSVDAELRCAECVENLTDLAACLEEAEGAAKELLKEIQNLQKKLNKLRNGCEDQVESQEQL